MAHLATINADGSPQVTVIWIGLDGDELVSAHLGWYAKLRNMDRDPRVVLSFDAPRDHSAFSQPLRLAPGPGHHPAQRRGLGPAQPAGQDLHLPGHRVPGPKAPGWIVRYSVERIGGVGPWVAGSH